MDEYGIRPAGRESLLMLVIPFSPFLPVLAAVSGILPFLSSRVPAFRVDVSLFSRMVFTLDEGCGRLLPISTR